MHVWDAPEDELVGHLHATRIPQPGQVVRQVKNHAERLLRTARALLFPDSPTPHRDRVSGDGRVPATLAGSPNTPCLAVCRG